MINCQNCGQINADGSNFCRYCGSKFAHFPMAHAQPQPQQKQEIFAPPQRRPYSWKTDEFKVPKKSSARDTRQIDRVKPIGGFENNTAPMHNPQPYQALQTNQTSRQFAAPSYRCPRCQTTQLPIIKRKISTAGWITFALLLLFTFIFFWVGLLMKEDSRVCPVCNLQLD